MALPTHLKRPKVIKLRGSISILITGFIRSVAIVRPIPVRARVSNPLSKTMPLAIWEIK